MLQLASYNCYDVKTYCIKQTIWQPSKLRYSCQHLLRDHAYGQRSPLFAQLKP